MVFPQKTTLIHPADSGLIFLWEVDDTALNMKKDRVCTHWKMKLRSLNANKHSDGRSFLSISPD